MFPPMRTGFDLVDDASHPIDDALSRKIGGLMSMFLEDAVETAICYVKAKGRQSVRARDIKAALQYEAQNFFSKPGLEERFGRILADEEDDEQGEEDDENGEEEDDDDTHEVTDDDDCESVSDAADEEDVSEGAVLRRNVDACVESWDAWAPADDAQALIKRSIDAVSLPAM